PPTQLVSFYSIFFHSYVHHRVLHSFPTRRSSDLEPCEDRDCPGKDTPQFKGIFIRYLAQLYRATGRPAYLDFLFRNAHSVWFNEDRKSTRLNSSHVAISYAVFCLKKKTLTEPDAD